MIEFGSLNDEDAAKDPGLEKSDWADEGADCESRVDAEHSEEAFLDADQSQTLPVRDFSTDTTDDQSSPVCVADMLPLHPLVKQEISPIHQLGNWMQ